MRTRLTALVLAVAGLLVAVAVGLAANSIASRSFTPGADALPSAGSLAPRKQPATPGKAATAPATTPKPKPKPKPKPATTPTTTTTAPDDHGGSGKGSSGKGSSGKGSGSGHGGKGSDD
jgi:uncharacterized membrane protein YgcG